WRRRQGRRLRSGTQAPTRADRSARSRGLAVGLDHRVAPALEAEALLCALAATRAHALTEPGIAEHPGDRLGERPPVAGRDEETAVADDLPERTRCIADDRRAGGESLHTNQTKPLPPSDRRHSHDRAGADEVDRVVAVAEERRDR